jgi:hypothetical protein
VAIIDVGDVGQHGREKTGSGGHMASGRNAHGGDEAHYGPETQFDPLCGHDSS